MIKSISAKYANELANIHNKNQFKAFPEAYFEQETNIEKLIANIDNAIMCRVAAGKYNLEWQTWETPFTHDLLVGEKGLNAVKKHYEKLGYKVNIEILKRDIELPCDSLKDQYIEKVTLSWKDKQEKEYSYERECNNEYKVEAISSIIDFANGTNSSLVSELIGMIDSGTFSNEILEKISTTCRKIKLENKYDGSYRKCVNPDDVDDADDANNLLNDYLTEETSKAIDLCILKEILLNS